MSCSCNCSPCNCQPRPSICCTPTVESVEYTFENANLAGIGVFDNDTDNLVQFRGVVSDSAALTVTLNATDNTIVLAFDQDALVADIPDADTTTRGILETSTNAEALAKAATNKILVPSNLAALGSTTTFAGLVELATNAETQAGLSGVLAVTPEGLASTYALLPTQQQFADSVARGAAAPVLDGQIGYQLDTDQPYVGFATGAGQWRPLLTLENLNSATDNTSVALNGFEFTFTGNGLVSLDGVAFSSAGANATFSNGATNFGINAGAGQTVDFANATIWIQNNPTAVASVITTNASSEPVFLAITEFLSSQSTQTGWVTPAGTLDRGGFTAYNGQVISNPPTQAEVQAMDDALVFVSQHLAALITDLKAKLLPAT